MGSSLLRRLIVVVVCLPCWLPVDASATALITVGDAVVDDGKAVVEIRLDSNGETVGGMQNDILWDERAIQLERVSDCVLRAEIGDRLAACDEDLPIGPCKTLSRNRLVCGNEPSSLECEGQSATTARFRGIVAATAKPNNNSIPDGVLYTCTFRVVDPERLPIVLVNQNVVLSDPFGVRLDVLAADGAVLAEPGSVRPSRPPTPAGTPTPRPTRTLGPVPSAVATGTLRPTWTRAPSATPSLSRTPTATPTPQPIGFSCRSSGDCRVGDCVDGTCCAAAFCPPNQYCNISGVAGTCAPRRLQGAGCDQDSDCVFANCDLHIPGGGHAGICGAQRTPTPLSPGDRCVEDGDCRIGLVCNVWESTCCEDDPCPSGYTCRNPAYPGVCVPLPTPTPLRFPNPERCDANAPEVCATGFCVDGVCCDRPACAVRERCDIAPFPGTCHEPLAEGADCAKDLDCEGALRCIDLDGSGKVCGVRPRTPTSAPRIPTPTEPPRRPTIVLYDDEGCAVGEPSGAPWWLLVGVAVGIFARRREARR